MAEWEWTFNGFTWGDDELDVVTVDGLFGLTVETANVKRSGNGSTPGRARQPERTFTMEVELAADTVEAQQVRLDQARAAWALRQDPVPLVFQVGGDIAKRIMCRPVRHSIPVDVRYAFQYLLMAVQFEAADPLIYSNTSHTVTTQRAEPGAGVTVPFTMPLVVPAATSSGSVSAPNAGTAPANWTARLNGPVLNPVLTHVEQGRSLNLSGNGGLDIPAGQWVDVATDGRHVLLLGTADRRINIRLPESRWFLLNPGVNTLTYEADSGAGTLELTYRDTWGS